MKTLAVLDAKNNIVVDSSPYHTVAAAGYDHAISMYPEKKLAAGVRAGSMTLDAGIAFFISQLAAIDPKIYETKYRNIVYQELVPVDTGGPAWMDQFDYISFDAATVGKFIGANAKDMPNVAIKARKDVIKVEEGGIGYSYSLSELEKSQQLNMPLDVNGARAANRGFEEHAQRTAFSGDADEGFTGLFNNVNVGVDNSADVWANFTQLQKFEDMNSLIIKVWNDSAQVHIPNCFTLGTNFAADLSQPMSEERPEITLLKYFMENNFYTATTQQPIKFRMVSELNDNGVGGKSRMMAYELLDENLVMKMPRMLEFLPPQPVGMRVEIPGRYKFGGVEFRYPGSAAYRDGQTL